MENVSNKVDFFQISSSDCKAVIFGSKIRRRKDNARVSTESCEHGTRSIRERVSLASRPKTRRLHLEQKPPPFALLQLDNRLDLDVARVRLLVVDGRWMRCRSQPNLSAETSTRWQPCDSSGCRTASIAMRNGAASVFRSREVLSPQWPADDLG